MTFCTKHIWKFVGFFLPSWCSALPGGNLEEAQETNGHNTHLARQIKNYHGLRRGILTSDFLISEELISVKMTGANNPKTEVEVVPAARNIDEPGRTAQITRFIAPRATAQRTSIVVFISPVLHPSS